MTMRGADIAARALADAGQRTLFVMSGNQLMPLFDAFVETKPRLVHVRHEAAAVHMADAWARTTGQPGIAVVPAGPGFANALSALYTAQQSDSAVVMISGHAPLADAGRGAFQDMPQAAMAAPFVKWSATIDDPDAIATGIAEALRIAGDGRPGPVHLAVPFDILNADGKTDARSGDNEIVPDRADAHGVGTLATELRAASKPLILAGPVFGQPGCTSNIAAAERAIGIPIVVMESPRGVADPSVGALSELLPEADLVMLLGRRPDYGIGFGKPFGKNARFVQVDADQDMVDLGKHNLGDRLGPAIISEPRAWLRALIDLFDQPHGATEWRNRIAGAIAYRPLAWRDATNDAKGIAPASLCYGLTPILDAYPDAIVIADGGEFGQWVQACLSPARRIINGPAGAIGGGLPFGIAAKLAAPDSPVLVLMGDGTAGFHLAEFETAARCGVPVIAIIGNDARWNAEHQIQLRTYGADRLLGCDLSAARYDRAAQGLGCHGEHVDHLADLAAAVDRAIASGLPACIDVRLDGQLAPTIRQPAANPST